MSGRRARDKGKRGEREVCAILTQNGWPAHRGWQAAGPYHPDIMTEFPYWIEVKDAERLNIYSAINQAVTDNNTGIPIAVVFRKNNHKWYAAIEFDHLIELVKKK